MLSELGAEELANMVAGEVLGWRPEQFDLVDEEKFRDEVIAKFPQYNMKKAFDDIKE